RTVTGDPAQRGLAGASLGGLISIYGAWQRPDAFLRVIGQSPSLFWNNESLTQTVAQGPQKPIKFYLDTGCPDSIPDNCSSTESLAQVLRNRGYNYLLVEEPGGQHDWAYWQRRLPRAFSFILP